MNIKTFFLVAGILSCTFASAQIGDVAPPVPGTRIDHQGLPLNPTPDKVAVSSAEGPSADAPFVFKGDKKLFSLGGFLPSCPAGTPLTLKVNPSAKFYSKLGIEPVSGAYRLAINGGSVEVTGFDRTGVFYGLQTLRQVIERKKGGSLPVMTVCDSPTLPLRGVIEGFYGPPWPHEVRLDLIDFMGRNKMNLYVYGPKDDPYHRTPSWREPYPADEAARIAELVKACKENLVEFAWAIHPGGDIRWDAEDYNNILKKFGAMYDLGVRSFAIFFDDIKGDGADAQKQADWLTTLKKDLLKAHKDIVNLILCPTEYAKARSKPGEDGALSIFGHSLDPSYKIFWTGDQVMSHVTKSTLEYVDSRTRRPALFWWNFPVSDYILPHILLGPSYGFDSDITSKEMAGLLTNPMEHGEASKVAIYSVADYTWNPKA
ncbi:MAG: beta-N-acetylglucosaminidase domain-containing protein, partial [Bacteroidales bacterium]|nr:beta-N-acetylglucosaminidase domain-containing protein [Bacteroidales bacterium]